MNVKVSIGEAIDKLSILELKQKKIPNQQKQIEIQKEIDELQECNKYKIEYDFYYKLLMYVNEKIWDITDTIKGMTIYNTDFARLSNDIFEYNQKRFRIKNWFNLSTTSELREQKSYAQTHCKIIIQNEDEIYNKIPEINYLLLEYDLVSFDIVSSEYTECVSCISIIKQIFKNPTIVDILTIDNSITNQHTVNISSYVLPLLNENEKRIFAFNPITYISGGLLGDFIQSLSVVCENFYNTGRKGIILISNKGDTFRYGLENTYNDTYSTIIKQRYVQDYKLFGGEHYDMDLTMWRNIPDIYNYTYNNNWHYNYSNLYKIDWGKHKWIEVDNDPKWSNKVLINTTNYRWPVSLNFNLLYDKYKEDLIYISDDMQQYDFFCETTKLNIEYYNITNFEELCCAISSCKLFVGSLSAPLAIAHSVNVNRICGLRGGLDDSLNLNLDKIWNNISYFV
jgi:hypothetical protein